MGSQSSSQGETVLVDRVIPIIDYSSDHHAFFERNRRQSSTAAVPDHGPKVKPAIFTIGSPEPESHNTSSSLTNSKHGQGFMEFLRNCFLCKKKLLNQDVYMYGYLCAFCSPNCREGRMALDGFDEEIANETLTTAGKFVSNDNKYQLSWGLASKFK